MNTRIGDGQTANMTFTNCETEFFMKLVLKCGEVLAITGYTPISKRFLSIWTFELEFLNLCELGFRKCVKRIFGIFISRLYVMKVGAFVSVRNVLVG